MQPARFRQEDLLLVEINNAKFTRPAVSSGEERGLLSRTAAGNRAYFRSRAEISARGETHHVIGPLVVFDLFRLLVAFDFIILYFEVICSSVPYITNSCGLYLLFISLLFISLFILALTKG